MWMCKNCHETIDPHFRRCWNCGSDDLGNQDPRFVNDAEPEVANESPRRSTFVSFVWMVLAICTFIGIMAGAIFVERWLPKEWNIRLSLTMTLLLLCFVSAVAINVASRLYLWVREYIYADEPAYESTDDKKRFVQIGETIDSPDP